MGQLMVSVCGALGVRLQDEAIGTNEEQLWQNGGVARRGRRFELQRLSCSSSVDVDPHGGAAVLGQPSSDLEAPAR